MDALIVIALIGLGVCATGLVLLFVAMWRNA